MEEFKSPPFTSFFTMGFVRLILAVIILLFVRFQLQLPAILSLLLLMTIESTRYWSRYGLRRLTLSQTLKPRRLFPGEEIKLIFQWKNDKILPVFLEWSQNIPPEFQMSEGTKSELSRQEILKWYETSSSEFSLQAQRRGCYSIHPPQTISRDGLGLFVSQRFDLGQEFEIIVYPQLLSLPELGLNPADLIGPRPDRRPILPDPINVSGLRDYTPDMPARLIQWKASAQKDTLLAKVQEATSDLRLCIAVDVDAFLPPGEDLTLVHDFEHALSLAATLSCWADEKGIPFGFVANGSQRGLTNQAVIPVGSGPNQAAEVLECLARLELKSSLPLPALLDLAPFFGGTTLVVLGNGAPLAKPPGVLSLVSYSCMAKSSRELEKNHA